MKRTRRRVMAWVAVALLAAYAVPHRIAGIMAGDHPGSFIIDEPSATSAARG